MSVPVHEAHPEIRRDLGLILLLAAFSALGQFANSVTLPSLPAIGVDLEAPMAVVQLTLSSAMFGNAAGLLISGPMADRFGRRPVLVFGLGLYLIATLACALAPSIEALIAARVLQAIGAGAVSVVGRAVTRDLYSGAELARAMAAIMIAFAAVPGLAPLLGGVIQQTAGWRTSFVVAALFGASVWIVATLRLPETVGRRLPALDAAGAIGAYRPILRVWAFWRPALVGAFIMASLFAFLAGSPAVFIDHLGVSPAEYGLYPAITILGFVGGGIVARRTAGRWTPEATIGRGIAIALAGSTIIFALGYLGWESSISYSAAMFVFVLGMGLAMPAAGALAIMPFPQLAGTAGGLSGVLQTLGGACGVLLVSLLAPLELHAFPTAMLIASLVGVGCWFGSRPKPAG